MPEKRVNIHFIQFTGFESQFNLVVLVGFGYLMN